MDTLHPGAVHGVGARSRCWCGRRRRVPESEAGVGAGGGCRSRLDRNGLRTKPKFEGGRTDQKQVWRTGRDPQGLDDDDLQLSRKRDPKKTTKTQTNILDQCLKNNASRFVCDVLSQMAMLICSIFRSNFPRNCCAMSVSASVPELAP